MAIWVVSTNGRSGCRAETQGVAKEATVIIDPTYTISRHQELVREAGLRRRGREYAAPRRTWTAARMRAWTTRVLRSGDQVGAAETVLPHYASPTPR